MREIRISIAGVGISISCGGPANAFRAADSYKGFIGKVDEPKVVIRCHDSDLPNFDLGEENKVFESGIYWDAYRVDGELAIALRPSPADSTPFCVAVFSTDFRRGDVYYYSMPNDSGDLLGATLDSPLLRLWMISYLAQGHGLLVHACGIKDRGKGLLFTGSSGRGKTTMARLWEQDAITLSDERIVLRFQEGELWMYGTPWHGEHKSASPECVPLDKIFFLHHATRNTIQPWKGTRVVSSLMSQCNIPYWDREGMRFTLGCCAQAAAGVNSYELGFVPDRDVVAYVRCVT